MLLRAIYGSCSCLDNRFEASLVSPSVQPHASLRYLWGLRRCAPSHPHYRQQMLCVCVWQNIQMSRGSNSDFPRVSEVSQDDGLTPLNSIYSAPHTFVYFVTQMYGSRQEDQPTSWPCSEAKMLLTHQHSYSIKLSLSLSPPPTGFKPCLLLDIITSC